MTSARTNVASARAEATFLGAMALVLAWYTWHGFQLAWSTPSSAIGPGLFPRSIGVAGLAMTLVLLARTLAGRATSGEDGAGANRHWLPLVAALVGVYVCFVMLFFVLGAFLATGLFSMGLLSVINPGRHLLNAVQSAGLAGILLLLFDGLLGTNFPSGMLLPF